MNLEHELREALRRKPAPADLVDRVRDRIVRETPVDARPVATRPAPRRVLHWLAAAAAAAIAVTGGARYYQEQRQIARAEEVQQQLEVALQVTNEKLVLAQQRLARAARD
jgi:hypothetical protein